MQPVRIVVTYDISSDRRRRRLARRLEGLLVRVQMSVFEGEVDQKRLQKICSISGRTINRRTDSVRIYRLCGRCVEALEIVGCGVFVAGSDDDVVV